MAGPLTPVTSTLINANTSSTGHRTLKELDDTAALKNSSVPHFRNLAQNLRNGSEIRIPGVTTDAEDVAGLQGRIRLQRTQSIKTGSRNWMDNQRKNIQAYEYLCHIGEAKEWLEACIGEPIPPVVQLEERLRDGVILAQLTKVFAPNLVKKIFRAPKLQWLHSNNIHIFFKFLEEVDMPDLFRFEFTDLYDKKNIPKVIYCIHALAFILSSSGLAPEIGDLVGKLEFTEDEIRDTQRGLDAAGINLPNFKTMSRHFEDGSQAAQAPQPEPEQVPRETEDERVDRELGEASGDIVALQAVINGAIARSSLRALMEDMMDSSSQTVTIQSHIRANMARAKLAAKFETLNSDGNSIVNLQSLIRGQTVRSIVDVILKELKQNTPLYVLIQSTIRGNRVRARINSISNQNDRLAFAKNVQSISRKYLVQQRLTAQQKSLNSQSRYVTRFQARARGYLVRKQVDDHDNVLSRHTRSVIDLQSHARKYLYNTKAKTTNRKIEYTESAVTLLQACVRGCLARRKLDQTMVELHSDPNTTQLEKLQAISRGKMLRRDFYKKGLLLESCHKELDDLKSRIRGSMIRATLMADNLDLVQCEERLPQLQAIIRRFLLKNRIISTIDDLKSALSVIVQLQSEARGSSVRDRINADHEEILQNEEGLIELQSRVRGMLGRFHYYRDLRAIDESEGVSVVPLQSLIRASFVRDWRLRIIGQISKHTDDIIELQSIIRGATVRVDIRTFEEELADEEFDSILRLQCLTRGYLVRKRFNERKNHFEKNMNQIIKIQSFVRAKQQADAYKALTTGKNPPLATVKNFVHLLTDNDLDFEEEVEYEKMRKQVVEEVHQNEQLEQFIDQLDVKIALLVKNKITLDEVIKHQRGAMPKTVITSSDPFDLRSLNKTSRRRLELYQGIFFVLQTQPVYLCNLFVALQTMPRVTEMEIKTVEGVVMILYEYAQRKREEFFFLKLLSKSMTESAQSYESPAEYVKSHNMWARLFTNYVRGAEERQFLNELLSPIVESVVSEEDFDLESDPLTIYHASINNEEMRTGMKSSREHNVVVDVAIKDPETRATYIKNLQFLREYALEFLSTLTESVESMPYGIRYFCRTVFELLQKHYTFESEDRLLSVVANVLYHRYMNGAIVAPDMFGIYAVPLNQLQKKNLSQIARIITQIASGRLFNEDNVFLQPLNLNLTTYITQMRDTIRQIIDIPDPEVHFDMDEYDDLTAPQRPTLHMKTSDIHSLHSIITSYIEMIAPELQDPLRAAVKELGPLPSNSNEILNIARLTEVKLDLNPSFISVEDRDAEVNSLFMAAKRCVLYIIRVQSGSNLLEVLIKPVTEDDERKYKAILEEEKASKAEVTYSSANALGDLSLLHYRDLKVIALEKIIELENLGKITRKNHFQDLLNAIANDIRTKRNRRIQRQKELEGAKQTLKHLADKESYLQTKLKSYNDYIEHSMSTLQAKKGKRRNIMPFTKQFFHMRELQKSGRVPKFGSFKYSAAKLLEKGVLIDLSGFSDRQYEKIDFTFSSDQIGVFFVEASQGSITLPGGTVDLTLDELLEKQFNNHQTLKLFDDMATFNTNLLLHLIFKKFYRDG
ncbi:hypothetical protein BZA70DRAFT_270854 [Myxozyma melibiosi]|uniref:Uncharacterized protein n=1 Tax=Myxozyma melibiosi TaxID=54550 RepID=A0ABR1FDY2_9ASCO